MQLFILNRTNERQTKSVGRILLYALLFFIVTRIAVMLMLTGCTYGGKNEMCQNRRQH